MGYNPCGAGIDWIRTPYYTQCQFFTSGAGPLVKIVWRPTNLPFIKGTSIINNRFWDGDGGDPLQTGEVTRTKYNRPYLNVWSPPAGANGKHQCNPQWYLTGQPWPSTLPPVEYGANGLPLCCGAFLHAPGGGVEFGGAVVHNNNYLNAPGGGVEFGGQVEHVVAVEHAPGGGFEFGGQVEHVVAVEHAPGGGVVFGGEVVHNDDHLHAPGGGVEFGGDVENVTASVNAPGGGFEVGGLVEHVVAVEHAPGGGFEFGGQVEHVVAVEHAPGGGVVMGGPVAHAVAMVHAPGGGVVMGGPVAHAVAMVHAPGGGAVMGGPVDHTYDPGSPTPGTNCAGAPTVTQGQTYGYTITAGMGVEQWFKFTLPSTGNWHIATTGLAMMGASLQVYRNGSCPLPNLLSGWTFGPPRWSGAANSGDVFWLKFTPPPMGSSAYTFVWDSGL